MVFNSRKPTRDAKQCLSCGADMNEIGRGCSWEKCKFYDDVQIEDECEECGREENCCVCSIDNTISEGAK